MYQGIIDQCMGTPRGFHWKNTQISLMQAVVEIIFALRKCKDFTPNFTGVHPQGQEKHH